MLELLEIVDGAVLVLVYLALTLFVPLAFFGAAAGVVATILRIPLSPLSRAFGERGARLPPVMALIRGLVIGLIPLAFGAAVVLFALDRLTGGTSTEITRIFEGGVRALIVALIGVQDAGMRSWTGLAPAEVVSRAMAVDGARPLAVFTDLVASHLAAALPIDASRETIRLVFDAAVGLVAATAIGLSPFRLVRLFRRPRVAAVPPAYPAGAPRRGM